MATRPDDLQIHLLHHLIHHISSIIREERRMRNTSETTIRGVYDGINLESRDIALPIQDLSHALIWTHSRMGGTDHTDTRSKRDDL